MSKYDCCNDVEIFEMIERFLATYKEREKERLKLPHLERYTKLISEIKEVRGYSAFLEAKCDNYLIDVEQLEMKSYFTQLEEEGRRQDFDEALECLSTRRRQIEAFATIETALLKELQIVRLNMD